MGSLYLNNLNRENRDSLERQLWDQQFGKCFIAGKPITLGFDAVDIDHIIPLRDNGKDDPGNFALTLSHFNRSKQAADLRVARVLARFEEIQETADSDDRGANLNDILRAFGGASSSLAVTVSGHSVTYIASGVDRVTVPLFTDKLSGMRYFLVL